MKSYYLNTIEFPAYAKLNLLLEVTGRRADGYHELETVFQRISLCDTLTVARAQGEDLVLQCDLPGLLPEDNLVIKAYRALRERFPALGGVKVSLHKRIPTEAGLGGGSADAAAFLLAMNQLFSLDLSAEELIGIAAPLGADVPTCLFASPMLGRGIGEKLSRIPSALTPEVVLLHPHVRCSTAAMYHRLDERPALNSLHGSQRLLQAMEQNDLPALGDALYNVFESVLPEAEIHAAKAALLAEGAIGALLTGSGSAVFGLFADAASADHAAEHLRGTHRVYRCQFINEGRDYL